MNPDLPLPPTIPLARLQSWMQAVITHPAGVGAGLSEPDAQNLVSVIPATLETVVTPSATLSGAERLAIYSRSYHARLLQCFEGLFPTLRRALGEELFSRFAFDYLQAHPSQSYTLDRLADDFPAYLSATRPDANAPSDQRETWPDFIIELATFELAFLKTFDGPGLEGCAPPDAASIGRMDGARLRTLVLKLAECLKVFAFRYPVAGYFLADRRGETPTLPAPADTFAALTRREYRVLIHNLTAWQYQTLNLCDGQRNLGEVLNHFDFASHGVEELVLRSWICRCVTTGYFESVESVGISTA